MDPAFNWRNSNNPEIILQPVHVMNTKYKIIYKMYKSNLNICYIDHTMYVTKIIKMITKTKKGKSKIT